MRAVEIEYMYYVKREKAREEQAALKEQMRQEAAERKALEEQRAQVVKEESKYKTEINNIQEQLNASQDDEQIELFKKRIAELEQQLSAVEAKKKKLPICRMVKPDMFISLVILVPLVTRCLKSA